MSTGADEQVVQQGCFSAQREVVQSDSISSESQTGQWSDNAPSLTTSLAGQNFLLTWERTYVDVRVLT